MRREAAARARGRGARGALDGLGRAAGALAEGMLEAAWPTRCAGCDEPGGLLCPRCRAALPAIEQRRACPRCGAPFGELVCTECTACLEPAAEGEAPAACSEAFAALDGVRCYGVLAWPLDSLVRAYKDGGERRASALLAAMAAQAYRESRGPGSARPDALAFVPCTPQAFARRGFDHMERVAADAARELRVPLADVLARRAPRDQRGLSKADRRGNADASFVVLGPVEGMSLVLLDDVVTTGSTMAAAARALRRAGAARVEGLAVARAFGGGQGR